MTDDLISRAAALDALDQHAHGATTLGGQTYRSITLEVAVEAIRALPAFATSQTSDPVVKSDSCQSVRVKPLVWHEGDEPNEWKSGPYDVWCELGKFQLYYWGIVMGEPHETAEAAKAAAQADNEQRILAAIETHPDPRDAVIAGLVDALEYADRMVRLDLIHMTDFDHDDFSQAVVDTGKRIASAIAAAKGGAA